MLDGPSVGVEGLAVSGRFVVFGVSTVFMQLQGMCCD